MAPVVEDRIDFNDAKMLSPLRQSTQAESIPELVEEQLHHFGIDPLSPIGKSLGSIASSLYETQSNVQRLWQLTTAALREADRRDQVAFFNAKKFICFQLAKILDTLQNPMRKVYQEFQPGSQTLCAKGAYPLFDNVTALFAANPVIVRTATYIYACSEWVDEAFQGKEFLHEIYSRLMNPTSIALANHIVDLEAGPYAGQYLAWNFNSGMSAIDALLSHQLRSGDIVLASRNVYGGTYQLLNDYYARQDTLKIALHWFDGDSGPAFEAALKEVEQLEQERIAQGARILIYLESPCNPFGWVSDIPSICRIAHERGWLVAQDATIATPFLTKPLQREIKQERPDFIIHSYTKDLTGTGNATAGVLIGETHRMFLPKGTEHEGITWDETLFWKVFYIKGGFLDADKAFEVMTGMKTLPLRLMQKSINTIVLARYLDSHPSIRVHANCLENHPNSAMREKVLFLGLPVPLFTMDFEGQDIPREAFVRFFDNLAPGLDHQVSLGQSNSLVLCPALTSHSEMDSEALANAGITPTTLRISVGLEDVRDTIHHLREALRIGVDPSIPGFSDRFMSDKELHQLREDTQLETHRAYLRNT